MNQVCDKCNRRYDDEFHSTQCPHKGIGFCAVCDCVVCVCTPNENERSQNSRNIIHLKHTPETPAEVVYQQTIDDLKREIDHLKALAKIEIGGPAELKRSSQ